MNHPVGKYGINRQATPVIGTQVHPDKRLRSLAANGAEFRHMLQRQMQPAEANVSLKISHHAQVRMQQRGIELDEAAMGRLQDAVKQAAAKGAKDALVLMREQAFIVSVNNRTIVTAMDANDLSEHVVTQIDSAVIIPSTK